jgi:hypothetical protein
MSPVDDNWLTKYMITTGLNESGQGSALGTLVVVEPISAGQGLANVFF